MKLIQRTSVLLGVLLLVCGAAAAAPAPADGYPNPEEVLRLTEWPMTFRDHGGTLLLSDSPETVPADGILYQDSVSGHGRLFFHHVNGTKENKKLVVLLSNDSAEAAQVTVYQHGLGGPGADYLQVGKAVQIQYMASPDIYRVEVPSGGSAHLIYQLDDLTVKPGMLVNGMYDFYADKHVKVSVLMLPVRENAHKFLHSAPVLPADEYRLRGTFQGYDRYMVPAAVYDPAQHGTVVLTLADNKTDPYVTGIDATDGSRVVNYGNYGVVYHIFLPSYSGGQLQYWLNPRGGTYAGALGIKYRYVPTQLNTPADRPFFGESTLKDIQKIGAFEAGQSLWLTFSPPGASNLPVKLILRPRPQGR